MAGGERSAERGGRRGIGSPELGACDDAVRGCEMTATRCLWRLEVPRDGGDDGVVGEEGVTIFGVVL